MNAPATEPKALELSTASIITQMLQGTKSASDLIFSPRPRP